MSQRLDALIVREYQTSNGDTKAAFTKIGTAWPAKQGAGFSIVLDALPLPSMSRDGKLECRILLREPLPARDDAPRNGTPARNNRAPVDDLDDSVPFGYAGEPARRSVFP